MKPKNKLLTEEIEMRAGLLASVVFFVQVETSLACDPGYYEVCVPEWLGGACKCVPELPVRVPGPGDVKPTDVLPIGGLKELIDAAGRSGDSTLKSAAQNLQALGDKFDKETKTAISNALTNPAQGVKDAVNTHVKAANDFVDAVRASVRFAERAVRGYREVLSENEKRVREGKVVDAIFSIQVDALRSENENAAQFMQESETARQAAQALASTYGGPAGAAAFAAWYAYNASTGNVDAALRAGAYTYLVGEGYAQVGAMPSGTIDEVVKKAAATAAVRGTAVAAAGGTRDEVLQAMASGGGAIIVQSGQAYVTKEYVDPAKSKGDAFCMAAEQTSCASAKEWIADSKRRLVEYKAKVDEAPNAILTKDRQWVISWDKEALQREDSKAPGVVLTYIGEGSPFAQQVMNVAAIGEPNKFRVPESESTSWAAIRDPGGELYFFDDANGPASSVAEGDVLTAYTSVFVRIDHGTREAWKGPIDLLRPGDVVKVLEVHVEETPAGDQEWIRFDRVD
jgi:hypothetical protein